MSYLKIKNIRTGKKIMEKYRINKLFIQSKKKEKKRKMN